MRMQEEMLRGTPVRDRCVKEVNQNNELRETKEIGGKECD